MPLTLKSNKLNKITTIVCTLNRHINKDHKSSDVYNEYAMFILNQFNSAALLLMHLIYIGYPTNM